MQRTPGKLNPIWPSQVDVGGTGGYEEYPEAMADPDHERHEEFLGWRGRFNPEAFDPAKATKRMRRGLPDWRPMR